MSFQAGALRGWQGAAVDFAAGRQRQRGQQDEGGRDHVIGQRLLQMGAEARDEGWRLVTRYHIRHQLLRLPYTLTGHDDRLMHGGMLAEHRFDLAQLDAEATDLHLVIGTAEEGDVAIWQVSGQVARFVQPARPKRVGDKSFCGQRRTMQIALGQTIAAQI